MQWHGNRTSRGRQSRPHSSSSRTTTDASHDAWSSSLLLPRTGTVLPRFPRDVEGSLLRSLDEELTRRTARPEFAVRPLSSSTSLAAASSHLRRPATTETAERPFSLYLTHLQSKRPRAASSSLRVIPNDIALRTLLPPPPARGDSAASGHVLAPRSSVRRSSGGKARAADVATVAAEESFVPVQRPRFHYRPMAVLPASDPYATNEGDSSSDEEEEEDGVGEDEESSDFSGSSSCTSSTEHFFDSPHILLGVRRGVACPTPASFPGKAHPPCPALRTNPTETCPDADSGTSEIFFDANHDAAALLAGLAQSALPPTTPASSTTVGGANAVPYHRGMAPTKPPQRPPQAPGGRQRAVPLTHLMQRAVDATSLFPTRHTPTPPPHRSPPPTSLPRTCTTPSSGPPSRLSESSDGHVAAANGALLPESRGAVYCVTSCGDALPAHSTLQQGRIRAPASSKTPTPFLTLTRSARRCVCCTVSVPENLGEFLEHREHQRDRAQRSPPEGTERRGKGRQRERAPPPEARPMRTRGGTMLPCRAQPQYRDPEQALPETRSPYGALTDTADGYGDDLAPRRHTTSPPPLPAPTSKEAIQSIAKEVIHELLKAHLLPAPPPPTPHVAQTLSSLLTAQEGNSGTPAVARKDVETSNDLKDKLGTVDDNMPWKIPAVLEKEEADTDLNSLSSPCTHSKSGTLPPDLRPPSSSGLPMGTTTSASTRVPSGSTSRPPKPPLPTPPRFPALSPSPSSSTTSRCSSSSTSSSANSFVRRAEELQGTTAPQRQQQDCCEERKAEEEGAAATAEETEWVPDANEDVDRVPREHTQVVPSAEEEVPQDGASASSTSEPPPSSPDSRMMSSRPPSPLPLEDPYLATSTVLEESNETDGAPVLVAASAPTPAGTSPLPDVLSPSHTEEAVTTPLAESAVAPVSVRVVAVKELPLSPAESVLPPTLRLNMTALVSDTDATDSDAQVTTLSVEGGEAAAHGEGPPPPPHSTATTTTTAMLLEGFFRAQRFMLETMEEERRGSLEEKEQDARGEGEGQFSRELLRLSQQALADRAAERMAVSSVAVFIAAGLAEMEGFYRQRIVGDEDADRFVMARKSVAEEEQLVRPAVAREADGVLSAMHTSWAAAAHAMSVRNAVVAGEAASRAQLAREEEEAWADILTREQELRRSREELPLVVVASEDGADESGEAAADVGETAHHTDGDAGGLVQRQNPTSAVREGNQSTSTASDEDLRRHVTEGEDKQTWTEQTGEVDTIAAVDSVSVTAGQPTAIDTAEPVPSLPSFRERRDNQQDAPVTAAADEAAAPSALAPLTATPLPVPPSYFHGVSEIPSSSITIRSYGESPEDIHATAPPRSPILRQLLSMESNSVNTGLQDAADAANPREEPASGAAAQEPSASVPIHTEAGGPLPNLSTGLTPIAEHQTPLSALGLPPVSAVMPPPSLVVAASLHAKEFATEPVVEEEEERRLPIDGCTPAAVDGSGTEDGDGPAERQDEPAELEVNSCCETVPRGDDDTEVNEKDCSRESDSASDTPGKAATPADGESNNHATTSSTTITADEPATILTKETEEAHIEASAVVVADEKALRPRRRRPNRAVRGYEIAAINDDDGAGEISDNTEDDRDSSSSDSGSGSNRCTVADAMPAPPPFGLVRERADLAGGRHRGSRGTESTGKKEEENGSGQGDRPELPEPTSSSSPTGFLQLGEGDTYPYIFSNTYNNRLAGKSGKVGEETAVGSRTSSCRRRGSDNTHPTPTAQGTAAALCIRPSFPSLMLNHGENHVFSDGEATNKLRNESHGTEGRAVPQPAVESDGSGSHTASSGRDAASSPSPHPSPQGPPEGIPTLKRRERFVHDEYADSTSASYTERFLHQDPPGPSAPFPAGELADNSRASFNSNAESEMRRAVNDDVLHSPFSQQNTPSTRDGCGRLRSLTNGPELTSLPSALFLQGNHVPVASSTGNSTLEGENSGVAADQHTAWPGTFAHESTVNSNNSNGVHDGNVPRQQTPAEDVCLEDVETGGGGAQEGRVPTTTNGATTTCAEGQMGKRGSTDATHTGVTRGEGEALEPRPVTPPFVRAAARRDSGTYPSPLATASWSVAPCPPRTTTTTRNEDDRPLTILPVALKGVTGMSSASPPRLPPADPVAPHARTVREDNGPNSTTQLVDVSETSMDSQELRDAAIQHGVPLDAGVAHLRGPDHSFS